MKTIFLAILLIITICFVSCSPKSSTNVNISQGTDLPVKISLVEPIEHGINITRIRATITKDDYINSLNLTIEDTLAYGTFENLETGTYLINVQVYDGETLIATGNGMGEVTAGETTTVYIEIEFVELTGNLEIIVIWEISDESPERILFIGNSYTYFNGGMGNHLQQFALSANPEDSIFIESITQGGATLEMHFNNSQTITSIETGNWNYVVLQEQSTRPVEEPELFYEYATKLDSVIIASGAKTAFFMTWAREYNPPMIEDLAAAYNFIGTELNAIVCPVGRAFQLCTEQHEEINLYSTDGSHPSMEGTYLAVCTFFGKLWNSTPVGINYNPNESIQENTITILQELAWNAIETY